MSIRNKERKNPALELSLGEKKGNLENKERKDSESRSRKRNEELEKRIIRVDDGWRDNISDEKLEEITKDIPQKEWHKLSFYKQILQFLERERIQAFQGLNI